MHGLAAAAAPGVPREALGKLLTFRAGKKGAILNAIGLLECHSLSPREED